MSEVKTSFPILCKENSNNDEIEIHIKNNSNSDRFMKKSILTRLPEVLDEDEKKHISSFITPVSSPSKQQSSPHYDHTLSPIRLQFSPHKTSLSYQARIFMPKLKQNCDNFQGDIKCGCRKCNNGSDDDNDEEEELCRPLNK